MAFVSDTFTAADGTLLQAHTGEIGATWAAHPNNVSNAVITSGAVHLANAGTEAIYYASGAPESADYDVEGTFRIVGTTSDIAFRLAARMSTTVHTYYMAGYNQFSGAWDLFKFVAGTPTSLGSWAEALGIGDERTAKLELRGTSIKLYINGVERISATDGDITAAGKAGFDIRGTGSSTNGVHLLAFSASDPATEGGLHWNFWRWRHTRRWQPFQPKDHRLH